MMTLLDVLWLALIVLGSLAAAVGLVAWARGSRWPRNKGLMVVLVCVAVSSCATEPIGGIATTVPSDSTTIDISPATTSPTTTTTMPTTTVPPTTTTTLPPRPTLPDAVVGGLVVSMGQPPADVVARYAEFGANVVMLWEASEAVHWSDYPAIVWATEDGQQIDDPLRKNEPDHPPLELAPNVVAVQVGDEPWPDSMVGAPGYKPVPARLDLPVPQYTNFSYWTPLTAGASDMEPSLDQMFDAYAGDRVMVSEYNLRNERNIRYLVLDYFRQKALDRGTPYWQYLNAYSGYETEMTPAHSPSDLAWSAFSGAAMGYTGHIWFGYQFGTEGHAEAIQGGGSVLYTQPGQWAESPLWGEVAKINAAVLAFSERVAQVHSTGVLVGWVRIRGHRADPGRELRRRELRDSQLEPQLCRVRRRGDGDHAV